MADQLTLIASLDAEDGEAMGSSLRHPLDSDTDALGRLYFESYDPGVSCDTLEEAIADIEASFRGDYGTFLPRASFVATDDGTLIGAVLAVHRPPWEGFPDCPLVIELFVAREHRRRGIARRLLRAAMDALARTGEPSVALRVDAANRPALTLYDSLGFRLWTG